ncbi:LysR family transcriptional regulator [Paenibacillus physcomitrellae]|uniref:Transcriptional regulator n=1 Tax=Paenibacillus physcomitrellae TaxID=1619311 RepID=A0ABQ1FVM8_9BACL|nr:LysR family transcriptional regulator [Paenibacillus physcomitrellae]GGA30979.1 transcriptional regulator [Paenibacillus physcomitrellae]
MNLEQMGYIKEIVHTQSISVAAQNLHVSQSAVSQSISLLEKELGIRLFKRTRFGTTPTLEGKEIITKALKIVEYMEMIKEEAQTTASILQGELKIAATPSLMAFFPKILSLFKKDYPHIKVTIIEMESLGIIEQVKKQQVDLGLTVMQESIEESLPEHIIFETFDYKPDVKVIVPKYSPLAFRKVLNLQDLADYPLVVNASQLWGNFMTLLEESNGSMNVLFKTSNSEVIKKTVAEGLAISFLSNYLLIDDPYIESGRIIAIPLANNQLASNLSFGWIFSDKNSRKRIIKKFLDYIDL